MNRQCPECGGWELGDGTEEADFNPCTCNEFDDGCMEHMWTPGTGPCPVCMDEIEQAELEKSDGK